MNQSVQMMDPEETGHGSAVAAAWPVILLGLLAAALYWGCFSRWYTVTDGPLRSLGAYRPDDPPLHPNNHLLYPAALRLWWAPWRSLGFGSGGVDGFLRCAVGLNALCAGATLSLFFWVAIRLTGHRAISLWGAVCYGLTHAFLTHATLPSEPMLGMPLIWGSMVLAGSVRGGGWLRVVASALCAAVAIWLYLPVVVVVPAIPLLTLLGSSGNPARAARVVCVAGWLFAFTAAAVGMFVAAHRIAGDTTGLGRLLTEELFNLDCSINKGMFGSFRLRSLRFAVLGAGPNLIHVPAFAGFGECLRRPFGPATLKLLAGSAAWGGSMLLAGLLHLRGLRAYTAERRNVLGFLAAGFTLSVVAGPVWWSGYYDKLWIVPVGFAVLMLTSALAWNQPQNHRLAGWLAAICAALVLAMGWSNLSLAVERHTTDDPCRLAAREMAELFDDRDLIIGGWSPVCTYMVIEYNGHATAFSLPDEAVAADLDADRFCRRLARAVEATARRRGRVLVIDHLDQDRARWDSFLGRVGVPFDAFDSMRSSAVIVRSWELAHGQSTTLFLVNPVHLLGSVIPVDVEERVRESQ